MQKCKNYIFKAVQCTYKLDNGVSCKALQIQYNFIR